MRGSVFPARHDGACARARHRKIKGKDAYGTALFRGRYFSALERKGHNSLNRAAAENCGGILGVAEGMVGGGWFNEVSDAAEVICTTTDIADAGRVAAKYGDTKI